ncbi:hypothetical protein R3I94_004334 [Phoxinus phoxinus]|uniref:C-type lectin domain-containing protein n=1 Tax=Phoxinus phoxinus TaxID=58324 RepID=A0AAN9HDW4_9TELE
MKITLTGLFLFVLYGLAIGIGVKVHIYVTTAMNCTSAQTYCKELYQHLSIVSNNEDLQMLKEAAGGTYPISWINSQENSCKSLKYEDTNTSAMEYLFENSSFFASVYEDTNTSAMEYLFENPSFCASVYEVRWEKTSCSHKFSFFCYENFILVQENKTWEEALEFCRTHYTDLAYFNYQWPVNQIKNETNNTQTDGVWTGLRFLNGNWLWLNVMSMTDLSLPSCPPEPLRCGARNTKTEQWENRDCEEKLNFLCLNK